MPCFCLNPFATSCALYFSIDPSTLRLIVGGSRAEDTCPQVGRFESDWLSGLTTYYMIYMWCTYRSCEASHHPTRLINYGKYRKNYVVNTKLSRRFGLNRSRLPILVENRWPSTMSEADIRLNPCRLRRYRTQHSSSQPFDSSDVVSATPAISW